jgi:hypothetical protein
MMGTMSLYSMQALAGSGTSYRLRGHSTLYGHGYCPAQAQLTPPPYRRPSTSDSAHVPLLPSPALPAPTSRLLPAGVFSSPPLASVGGESLALGPADPFIDPLRAGSSGEACQKHGRPSRGTSHLQVQ